MNERQEQPTIHTQPEDNSLNDVRNFFKPRKDATRDAAHDTGAKLTLNGNRSEDEEADHEQRSYWMDVFSDRWPVGEKTRNGKNGSLTHN